MNNFKDYYEILGVEPTATFDKIRNAYLQKAKELHPDMNKRKDSTKEFQELNEAYTTLMNEEKRKAYDKHYNAYKSKSSEKQTGNAGNKKESKSRRPSSASGRENTRKSTTSDSRRASSANRRDNTRRRTTSSSRRTSSAGKREYSRRYSHYYHQNILEKLYFAYKEVRNEERIRSQERQREIDGMFKHYPRNVVFRITKGTVYVADWIWQTLRLKHKLGDSNTKYVIRNRRSIVAMIAAGTIIATSICGNSETPQYSSDQTIIATGDSYNKDENDSYIDRTNLVIEVQVGDTISQLAEDYNTTSHDIIIANHLDNDSIYAGKLLKIPCTPYDVVQVDVEEKSIENLANEYHTDAETIYRLNRNKIVKIGNLNDDIRDEYLILDNILSVPKFEKGKTLTK